MRAIPLRMLRFTASTFPALFSARPHVPDSSLLEPGMVLPSWYCIPGPWGGGGGLGGEGGEGGEGGGKGGEDGGGAGVTTKVSR